MSTPHRWQVRADRRTLSLQEVQRELHELASGVEGVSIELTPHEHFEGAPDQGTFRDFTPVATLSSRHEAPLEFIAEELLEIFGWVVDFKPL